MSDPGTSYRSRDEIQEVRQSRDPITNLREKILTNELSDAAELKAILCEEGAELVIHGHNHQRELRWLECGNSRIPAIGVPSATMTQDADHPAEWNFYDIARHKGGWQTRVQIRQWQNAAEGFVPAADFVLGP